MLKTNMHIIVNTIGCKGAKMLSEALNCNSTLIELDIYRDIQ